MLTSGATMAVINNGTAATKMVVRTGTLSAGAGQGVAGQLVATTSGATGNAGGIFVSSDRALTLGAVSAGGNIDIATTTANALTVSGAMSTAAQTASGTPSGNVTLTSGAGIVLNNSVTTGSATVATSGLVPELTRRVHDLVRSGDMAGALRGQFEIVRLFDMAMQGADFPEGYRVAASRESPLALLKAVDSVQPDIIIIDTESPARDVLEHVVIVTLPIWLDCEELASLQPSKQSRDAVGRNPRLRV